MSMETDARAYIGVPFDAARTVVYESAEADAEEPVTQYRNALADAAQHGRLTDEVGMGLADRYLKTAAGSVSATALILLERELHAARKMALNWSNGKSDRSSEVIGLERLAEDAAQKVRTDLVILTY